MISIERNGAELRVVLESGVHTGTEPTRFVATYNCGAEWAAYLLRENINDRMRARLSAIRKEAYEQGWKDAKSKKGAKTAWFSQWWK